MLSVTQASTSSSSFLVSSLWGFKGDRSRVFVCGRLLGAQGTGIWKMSIGNEDNEDNEDNDRARVQFRFCSHFSFFPFPVLVPRSPFAFLVTFHVRSRDWWLSVSEGYFSDNYICRVIRFNLKMGRFNSILGLLSVWLHQCLNSFWWLIVCLVRLYHENGHFCLFSLHASFTNKLAIGF